ncbi:MAG TPA: glycoside hydrolase family 57 protein [Candidatus Omnitrophota bacterium]|nr:glycoside hydrolase family 57 protein [Candidatus Omnitrophota bacterium]HRZ15642.1 glycoside hydrolase family 57 protein [Candidatus Omnitrophota bacterium]
MVYLAIVYHMHQPYYKNLLNNQTDMPWVRLHGIKDYLDMLLLVQRFPKVHLTINMVPSLMEQIDDYEKGLVKDRFLDISAKPAAELNQQEKDFVINNFFMINKERVIARYPRYYELYFMKETQQHFSAQDVLDLQVWFNLAWFDPMFTEDMPELRKVMRKARFFNEQDKKTVLKAQLDILKQILPAYRKAIAEKQVEITVTPYYHPILPLLYNTRLQLEANLKSTLPPVTFSYPEDARQQINMAVEYFKNKFGVPPVGMWPSEESVCEHIVPYLMQAGIKWIVTDEAILFKSLKRKRRDTRLLYQPHVLHREEGDLNIIFRDRNLSDLIGFVYPNWLAQDAVNDFMGHIENISKAYKGKDVFVAIALDGENAWEYYKNDGHDFLETLYQRLSDAPFVQAVTPSEYFEKHPPTAQIKRLSAGSWIYGEFSKWINNPYKNKGWEYLTYARQALQRQIDEKQPVSDLTWKQMHVAEGSDWYWWLGEDYPGYFDSLFRMHLSNFYTMLGRDVPDYLKRPISP